MQKTICIVHGVGFHTNEMNENMKLFAKDVETRTGAICTYYHWNHPGFLPVNSRHSLLFKEMYKFTGEVIMDFTFVTKEIDALLAKLPPADMYVGHSAGGVIVGYQNEKPTVMFGSPYQMVRNASLHMCSEKPVLNIMHYRDPIAAQVYDATNEIIYMPYIAPYINPISAHSAYWRSAYTIKRTVDWFKRNVK